MGEFADKGSPKYPKILRTYLMDGTIQFTEWSQMYCYLQYAGLADLDAPDVAHQLPHRLHLCRRGQNARRGRAGPRGLRVGG